jgi:hypothetical protein
MNKSAPRIVPRPLPGVTPEETRDARARAWTLVFNYYGRKEAAPASRPDDVKKIKNGYVARSSVPE